MADDKSFADLDWLDDLPAAPAALQPSEFTAAELQAMKFPPVRYVIEGLITDGLTILAGRPKLGKSWLALDFCVAVACGGYTLGDTRCVEGDVLYLALEDNARRLQDRMQKVCARADWPTRLRLAIEWPRLNARGADLIRSWIADHPRARLIVVDVLDRVRAAKDPNEAAYSYDYRCISPLKAIADEFRIAIIVIHHTRKLAAEDPLEIVSGTNGLTGAADTVLVLDRNREGCVLYGRGRDIPEIELAVKFDISAYRWHLLGEAAEVRRSNQRARILRALSDAEEPIGPAEIAKAAGMREQNVRFLLGRMVKAGEIVKIQRGLYARTAPSPNNAHVPIIEDEE